MRRNILLVAVLVLIAGAIYYLDTQMPMRPINRERAEVKTSVSKDYPRAKELVSPEGFVNSDGITIGELIGKKVILVDFWTYSCINCQCTQPYLNAWYEKYHDLGLEIIGVHTPEFEFEKNLDNVRAAVRKAGIKYPVVQDNDFQTWQAYGNRYWPRKYLIDLDGYIVYDHIGEGGYEETEMKIQDLLHVSADIAKPETTAPTQDKPLTPELYLGSLRNSGFLEKFVKLNAEWHIAPEYAESKNGNASISLPYKAKKVYMVASSETPITVRITRDGEIFKTIKVSASDLYILVDDAEYGEHTLEIIPESAGVKIYTFTFG